MDLFTTAPRKKQILSTMLFLLCIFGSIGIVAVAQKGSGGRAPIKGLRITIEVTHREELFNKLHTFAKQHSFKISMRNVEVIPKGTFIEMYREDLEISAISNPSDPTKIDLNFYEVHPKIPISDETVDALFRDIKNVISEIPNVTITED